MTDEQFMTLVEEGVAALPKKIHRLMQNVAIVIEDDMESEKKAELGFSRTDVVFGLYEGVPQPERGVDYQAVPDKITIFKKPILEAYENPEDIKECVENTVWHEVAHHFGFGDEWIAKEEERRGKIK